MSTILALLETRDGKLRPASQEVLGAARTLADARSGRVVALVTESAGDADASLGGFGADEVLVASGERHSPDGAAATAARVARETSAEVVLLAATVRGRDLQGRIAALLDTGFASDCTAVDPESLVWTRPVYGGRAVAKVRVVGPVAVASLRGNHFPVVRREAEAEVKEIAPEPGQAHVVTVEAKQSARPDVAEAARVIAGGRGMGGPENWHLLERIADAVPGMALGASRAVVDAGWRPHSEQVGQTGKTVSPELYVAAGISGAIQHLAGMNSSKVIVAINRDPEAPIFQHATYGIVGDVNEVLPALAEELEKQDLQ